MNLPTNWRALKTSELEEWSKSGLDDDEFEFVADELAYRWEAELNA